MLRVAPPLQSPYRLDDLAGVLTDVMASINSSVPINWLGLYPPAAASEPPAVHLCLEDAAGVDLVRNSAAEVVGDHAIQDDLQGGFRTEIAGADLTVWTLEGGLL